MQEITEHVSVFPAASLRTALKFVKGESVNSHDISLAAINVCSYGCKQMLPDQPPIFGSGWDAEEPTKEEAIQAIEGVLPDDDGTMKAGGFNRLAWGKIIKTLLPLLIGLL